MSKLMIAYVLIVAFLFTGWVMNLVKFCKYDFEPSYKAEVIRGICIFLAPVGGVVGWFDIKDKQAK